MEKRKYIDDSLLETLSVEELSDLIVRVSTILKNKIKRCETISYPEPEREKPEEMVESREIEDIEESKPIGKKVWKIKPDFDLMKIEYPEEPVNVWEVKILDKMDTSGRPVKEIQQVGAKISKKAAAEMEKFRKEWFEAGGDVEGSYRETKKDKDSQWNRVLSVNGISPTITKTEPPMILVCNEVLTNTDPVEIEVDVEVVDPTKEEI